MKRNQGTVKVARLDTAANLATVDARLAQRRQIILCDGLQYPCSRPARHRVVMNGPNYEAIPVYLTASLCDECKAEWESWSEVTA